MNRFSSTLLLFLVALTLPVYAVSVADSHTEMAGCESCHAEGEPSEDLVFENTQCQDCHGPLSEMEGDHPVHQDILNCSDCHRVHEEQAASEVCADCH